LPTAQATCDGADYAATHRTLRQGADQREDREYLGDPRQRVDAEFCDEVNLDQADPGLGDSEARDMAIRYKESRRLWYRGLLAQLDVDDPDTLATRLSLLIDGAYAAMLVRKDPAMMQAAIAAARVLLKSAGVRIGPGGAGSAIGAL
jgi:hypothetical protein